MYIVLYNPLSNKGRGKQVCSKLERFLKRKKESFKTYNLIELVGKEEEHINGLKSEDKIVLVGGDGTLHQFINRTRNFAIRNLIYMYRAGSGNDFSRGHKKGRFFEITNEIKALPRVKYNNKYDIFLNGVGIGIDAAVCEKKLENELTGLKQSYFNVAIQTFKKFPKFSMDIEIDGIKSHYDNVWFVTIQNGKYFGGGMKIAPKALRDDDHLDIVIVYKIKLWKLLCIFPLIFVGKHATFAKSGIDFINGRHIVIDTIGYDVMQKDGEVVNQVNHMEVERYW